MFAVSASRLSHASIGTGATTDDISNPHKGSVIVQRGDTFNGIAARLGVSPKVLREANPEIKDPNWIFPGQEIKIPSGQKTALPEDTQVTQNIVIVQRGDTFNGIAVRLGVSPKVLHEANPQIVDRNWIFPEQKITVPSNLQTLGEKQVNDTVNSGDTFHSDGIKSRPLEGINVRQDDPVAHLEVARKYLDLHEVRDKGKLEKFMGVNPEKTAWCAAFVNAVLKEAGIKGTGNNVAKSFLQFGHPTNHPKIGDIVVFNRADDPNGWQGHVGFYQGRDNNGNILVLGGNQDDKVSIAPYSANLVNGYRSIDNR